MKAPGRVQVGGAPTTEQEQLELFTQAERLEAGLRPSLGRLSQPFNSFLSHQARVQLPGSSDDAGITSQAVYAGATVQKHASLRCDSTKACFPRPLFVKSQKYNTSVRKRGEHLRESLSNFVSVLNGTYIFVHFGLAFSFTYIGLPFLLMDESVVFLQAWWVICAIHQLGINIGLFFDG